MKTLVVRLPEPLFARIEAEARERKITKSDVVRERLDRPLDPRELPPSLAAVRSARSRAGFPVT